MECTDLTEDEILAVLEKPIRDITENWNIDLSQHLQKYLNMLEISEINEDRLNVINFQKAAQVIQNSAYIYSKKVDYLWEVLLRVLEVLRTKSEYPLLQKSKIKKPNPSNNIISSDFCELDDLSDGDSDINIPSDFDAAPPPLKLLPKYNPSLETNFSEKKLYILSSKGIIIGNKYDFRVNRYLSETGALVAEPQIGVESFVASTSGHSDNIEDDCYSDSHLLNSVAYDEPINSCDDFEPHSSYTVTQNGDYNNPPNTQLKMKKIIKVPEVLPQRLAKRNIKRKNGETQPADILSYLVEDIASKCKKNRTFFSFVEYYNDKKKDSKNLDPFFNSKTEEIIKISKDLATEFCDEFYGFETESLLSDDCNEINEDDNMDCASATVSTCANETELHEGTVCDHSTNISDESYARSQSPTFEEFSKNLLSNSSLSRQEDPHVMETVNKWHESIKDKLSNSEKRHQCNLKEYSSQILKSFAKSVNSTVSFNDIVHEKVQEDVPRYFLASLMLANSYTVKVGTTEQGCLAMDCMELTLLKHGESNG